jgi:two-component system, NarL family, nitrate/nitrite response regulator NarL
MRVLVVDDHALFREGMRLLLLSLGSMECEVAPNADEGLRLARSRPFDVVLLDWHMEGLSGADAIRSFREATEEARIVVVSAEKSSNLVRSAIDAGAVGFIPKESPPDVLQQALNKIAEGGIYLPSALLAASNARRRGGRTPSPRPSWTCSPRSRSARPTCWRRCCAGCRTS